MLLKEKLFEDMKLAQKAGDKLGLSVLRMVRASIKNKEIEIGGELDDENVINVIASAIKQRKDSNEQFLKADRQDLADKEKSEINILLKYMPEQVDEDEIRQKTTDIIAELGACSIKDMGKVMKALMSDFKGRADGPTINKVVKDLLTGQTQ